MSGVPVAIQNAVEAGRSNIASRIEIYEGDGVTPFDVKVPRLIDGSVGIDQTRTERRNLTVTLDNRDGRIVHDPQGFWYDKVIKAFRGLTYDNPKRYPTIALVGETEIPPMLGPQTLARLDQRDFKYYQSPVLGSLDKADIVFALKQDGQWSASFIAMLNAAWAAGKNIITVNNRAVFDTAKFYTTTAKSANVAWVMTPATGDVFYPTGGYSTPGDGQTGLGTELIPTILAPGVRPLLGQIISSTQTYPVVYAVNSVGAKWLHYAPPVGVVPSVPYLSIINATLTWMYPTGANLYYEKQVGEYLIDSIKTPRHPRHVEISCRDYSKRLLLNSFDAATTFTAGTSVDAIIRALGNDSMITKYDLHTSGLSIPADIAMERDGKYTDVLKAISESCNIEWFFTGDGKLSTRLFNDPTTSQTTLTLTADPGVGNLVDWDLSSDDSQLFNYVRAVSGNSSSQDDVFFGTAKNTSAQSLTSIKRIGVRKAPIYEGNFTSNDQAQAWAERLLSVSALEAFDLNFSSFGYFWLDGGEIVQFNNPMYQPGTPMRFLLSSFTIPLKGGPSTGGGKRITVVGS